MSVNVYLQGVKMELDGKKINFMGDSITEGGYSFCILNT